MGYVILLIFYSNIFQAAQGQDVDPPGKEEFLTKFQDYNDVIAYLYRMQRKYPNLMELENLGFTEQNREILLAKIGTKTGSRRRKPSIWVDSAMHAREWISVSLLRNYESDNSSKEYVDKLTWYILPIVNPDGYEFSRLKNFVGSRTHFLWRKNRRPADCVVETCDQKRSHELCYGVDLNRNFGFHWGETAESGGHASNDSCNDQYIGPKPFSERESYVVQDFILRHASRLKAYLTLHSYGQMWFYPYGYKKNTYSKDSAEMRNLALRATAALAEVYGTKYEVGTSADIYYPASGAAVDWVKGIANVKYVYGIELRPGRDTEMAAFLMSWEAIEPTVRETWAAIKVVADEVIRNYA